MIRNFIDWHALLNSFRWRTRFTLWLAALVAGLVVVGFAKLAELALGLFFLFLLGDPGFHSF